VKLVGPGTAQLHNGFISLRRSTDSPNRFVVVLGHKDRQGRVGFVSGPSTGSGAILCLMAPGRRAHAKTPLK
jgi:hypothetical protein